MLDLLNKKNNSQYVTKDDLERLMKEVSQLDKLVGPKGSDAVVTKEMVKSIAAMAKPKISELLDIIKPLISKPKDGTPGKDGKDGTELTPEELMTKLKSIRGDGRLLIDDIRGGKKMMGKLVELENATRTLNYNFGYLNEGLEELDKFKEKIEGFEIAINNVNSGTIDTFVDSGVVSGNDLTLTLNDLSTVVIDVSSLTGGGVQSVTGSGVDNTDPDNPVLFSLQSVVAGTNVTIDNTDPENPIISASGGAVGGQVDSVVAGTGISVDNTDPVNPVVSSTITQGVESVTGSGVDNTDPLNPVLSSVQSVVGAGNISVDSTDPENPIVSVSGLVESVTGSGVDNTDPDNPVLFSLQSVVGGTDISIDNTDPENPVINSTVDVGVESVTGSGVDNTDPANPVITAVETVSDDGDGVVTVDNTDPENPVVGFGGVNTDSTISGDGTSANPLSATGGGSSIVSLTANEDLTAGDTVGFASTLEDTVMKAVWSYREQVDTNSQTDDSSSGVTVCEINTNKYVVGLQWKPAGTSIFRAVVVQLNDDMTWTIGNMSANLLSLNDAKSVLCKVDTDKFIVANLDDDTTYEIDLAVCSVSGTTITPGSGTIIASGDSATNIDMVQLDADRVALIVFAETNVGGSHECDLYEITVSGTTPTAGTVQNIIGGFESALIERVDTNKIAMFLVDGAASGSRIYTASVSGGTWTVSSPVIIPDDLISNVDKMGIISNTTNELFITGQEGTNTHVYKYDVSGAPSLIASGSVGYNLTHTALVSDNTDVYLFGTGTDSGLSKLTISGSDIVISDSMLNLPSSATLYAVSSSFQRCCVSTSDNQFISFFGDNSGPSNEISLLYHIQGMTDKFAGIAQSTVSKGGTVNVVINGIDSNQTGLAPNAYYNPLEGGLEYTATQGVNSVVAKSSTSIKV